MTGRTQPTPVAHFTAVEHLTTVIKHGLLSDSAARDAGLLTTEIGNVQIKEHRRQQAVALQPGGVVADYVPFYFAPRSPMMFAISRGNVPTYTGGTSRLVYLLSTLERLHELGHELLLTDRNAALNYTAYRAFNPVDPIDDDFIDWELMTKEYWNNTAEEPQRLERRMAEALVHGRVAWEAITQIGAHSEVVAAEIRSILPAAYSALPVIVRPQWYF